MYLSSLSAKAYYPQISPGFKAKTSDSSSMPKGKFKMPTPQELKGTQLQIISEDTKQKVITRLEETLDTMLKKGQINEDGGTCKDYFVSTTTKNEELPIVQKYLAERGWDASAEFSHEQERDWENNIKYYNLVIKPKDND